MKSDRIKKEIEEKGFYIEDREFNINEQLKENKRYHQVIITHDFNSEDILLAVNQALDFLKQKRNKT